MLRALLNAVRDPRRAIWLLDQRGHRREVESKKRGLESTRERAASIEFISSRFGCDAAAFLAELQTSRFREELRAKKHDLKQVLGARERRSTSSQFDCETLYMTVRACRPEKVVETGVLHGTFSAHILEALDRNGGGKLWSLDLPASDPSAPGRDALVPARLKGRNEIVLGDTRDTLAGVLRQTGAIDLFLHDSLHTFEHMTWEYLSAHRALRPRGVLTSHDVLGSRFHPNAFPSFADGLGYDFGTFRNFGIAIKPRTCPESGQHS